MKNSRTVGFLQYRMYRKPQNNNYTNITTMVVSFAPHTTWYLCIHPIGDGQPLPKGFGEGTVEAIKLNC